MNKAFTKEETGDEAPPFRSRFQPLPPGFRNLITVAGAARFKAELDGLVASLATEPVPPDAQNLTPEARKKLLRMQIEDLAKRLNTHEVVAPGARTPGIVSFGSTVAVRDEAGGEHRYKLVGLDETNPNIGHISWTSPLGRALLNQRPGGLAKLQSPSGDTELEIVGISLEDGGVS